MRTICLKFVTDANKPYRVSLSHAADGLESGEGAELVKKALDTVLDCAPFNVELAGAIGAEVIERRSIDLG